MASSNESGAAIAMDVIDDTATNTIDASQQQQPQQPQPKAEEFIAVVRGNGGLRSCVFVDWEDAKAFVGSATAGATFSHSANNSNKDSDDAVTGATEKAEVSYAVFDNFPAALQHIQNAKAASHASATASAVATNANGSIGGGHDRLAAAVGTPTVGQKRTRDEQSQEQVHANNDENAETNDSLPSPAPRRQSPRKTAVVRIDANTNVDTKATADDTAAAAATEPAPKKAKLAPSQTKPQKKKMKKIKKKKTIVVDADDDDDDGYETGVELPNGSRRFMKPNVKLTRL